MSQLIATIKNSLPMRYWSCTNPTKLEKELHNYIPLLKKDGAWYRAVIEENGVILQSRTISKVDGLRVEKQDNVPNIVNELSSLPNNTVLLGEVCFADCSKTSKDVVGIMGCLPAKAIERQETNPVYYYIFDLLAYDGESFVNKPFKDRLAKIQEIFANNSFNYLMPPEVGEVEDISTWLEQGEEGAVLMHKDKPYVMDMKSAKAWYSVKQKQAIGVDLDAVVIAVNAPTKEYNGNSPQTWPYWLNEKTQEKLEGLHFGKGYTAISKAFFHGHIGGYTLGAYYGDTLLEVCKVSNLSDEIAAQGESNVGRVVRFTGMSVDMEAKSIRHPKFLGFHADKNPAECLYEDIFGR